MVRDPELKELIEQAARNLRTLELLLKAPHIAEDLQELQQRIAALKEAYLRETNALTRHVLRRAVERRTGLDRRRRLANEPVGAR